MGNWKIENEFESKHQKKIFNMSKVSTNISMDFLFDNVVF